MMSSSGEKVSQQLSELSKSAQSHQISNRTCIQANSISYEGDSEEGTMEEFHRQKKIPSMERSYCSSSSVDFDSTVGHLPHSQHIRHVKSTSNSPHTRHHRGCNWSDSDKVALLVDGKRFIISPCLLIKHPNTMLGR